MSLFIKIFDLAHTDELADHVGKDKIANTKRFFLARHVQMDNPVNSRICRLSKK